MLCPTCRADGKRSDLRVTETRRDEETSTVERRRRCIHDSNHVFSTLETIKGPDLKTVALRSWHNGEIFATYSEDLLAKDLKLTVGHRLTPEVIARIAGQVSLDLEMNPKLLHLVENDDKEYIRYLSTDGSPAYYIFDHTVIEATERILRKEDRIAFILYALAFRGAVREKSIRNFGKSRWTQKRKDFEQPENFSFLDARSFLKWISKEFEDHSPILVDLETLRSRDEEYWSRPRTSSLVPKRLLETDKGFAIHDFRSSQLRKTLENSLIGRPQRKFRSRTLAAWVIEQLSGQDTITDSQLWAMILQGLRQVDDIAYLRYSIRRKNVDSVQRCIDEAVSLVEHPSPYLVLDTENQGGSHTIDEFVTGFENYLKRYQQKRQIRAPETAALLETTNGEDT